MEVHLVATQQGRPQLELAGSAPLAPQIEPLLSAASSRLAAAGFALSRLGTEDRPRLVLTCAQDVSET